MQICVEISVAFLLEKISNYVKVILWWFKSDINLINVRAFKHFIQQLFSFSECHELLTYIGCEYLVS